MTDIAIVPLDPSCYGFSGRPRTGRHQFVRWLVQELGAREDVTLTLFPDGYGANKTAFSQWLYHTYAGEFVVQNGTVQGLALAETFDALPSSEDVRELKAAADVYFEKV